MYVDVCRQQLKTKYKSTLTSSSLCQEWSDMLSSTTMVSALWLNWNGEPTYLFVTGIPVKHFPDNDEKMKAVQFAALMADLVKHTTYTLKSLNIIDQHSL